MIDVGNQKFVSRLGKKSKNYLLFFRSLLTSYSG